MITDLRQAFRLLLKSPGFTSLVVAVLAIGIGATTVIFSIVDGVLLKPLPFPDADRLIAIQSVTHGDEDGSASVPDVTDLRAARTQVKLGKSSVNTVEVLSGLRVGDRVILSDMSQYDGYDRIRLK